MNRCLLASLERLTCSASNIPFLIFWFLLRVELVYVCCCLFCSNCMSRECVLTLLYIQHTHSCTHTASGGVPGVSNTYLAIIFISHVQVAFVPVFFLSLSLPLHKLVFWLLRSRIPPSTCLEVVVVVALLLGPITLQSEFGSFLCHFWHLNWFILFICHQHPPLSNPPKNPYFSDIILLVAITICHGAMAHGEGCDK